MVVGRKITFKDEKELKEFQDMAREFGMTLSSFVRYAMRFTYENRNVVDRFNYLLEEVSNKLDSLTVKTDDLQENTASELDKIKEIMYNSVSSYNVLKLKEKLIYLMNEDAYKWWSFSEFVNRLGLEKNYSLQREFRVLIESDKEFNALVERKIGEDGDIYFKLRDEMLPVVDDNYEIIPKD
ncbi:hypothetical protein [Methanothermococcus okinawensis]|uniref:Uncharacterized protein n=1 Tax=Methanothermococcus okinawensis (strain DSM 14208 / JCM 11175 / IH1) TaxID=647113 RepID=F8AKN8_METOI|nr:hypothetical protein [Methanothermococcus okinawensis]AEH06371.1 hypothetical protein Metok_0383 [Methanothermococcus okinawensis IH1]